MFTIGLWSPFYNDVISPFVLYKQLHVSTRVFRLRTGIYSELEVSGVTVNAY